MVGKYYGGVFEKVPGRVVEDFLQRDGANKFFTNSNKISFYDLVLNRTESLF